MVIKNQCRMKVDIVNVWQAETSCWLCIKRICFWTINGKYCFWCITICFIMQHSPPYCASWACTTTKRFVVHHEDYNNKNQPFLNYPSNSLSWNFSSKISNLWQDHIYFFNIKLNSNRKPGHSYVHMTLWRKKRVNSSFEIWDTTKL